MVQRKVIVRGATNQALDELDADDIPALAYEASGAVAYHNSIAENVHGIVDTGELATFDQIGSAVSTHAGAADPHTGYLKESEVSGFATPAVVLGTAAAAGAATTAVRSDATLLAFDATAPVTQAYSDAAATGAATVAARRDHKHGMPAGAAGSVATDTIWDAAGDLAVGTGADTAARLAKGSDGQVLTVDPTTHLLVWATPSGGATYATPAIVLGTAAAAGAASTGIRSDATLLAFDATTPAAIGTAAAGSAAVAGRRDHVHATGAGTPSTQLMGDAAATGSGPAAAMTDHKHAMPPLNYLPYRTGGTFYYGWWTGAVSTLVLVQNTMYCAPFFVPVATTFTKIGVVSAAIASSQARLGIYSDTAGVPNALVLDAGAVATTAAAFDVITISQALTPGWYWLACAVQGAAGSLYCNNGGFFANAAVPVATPGSSFIAGGYSVTGISGALPSPWGATKTETARVPNMWLAPA